MDSGEDIVVSGMAGLLPDCENIQEFMDALINGVDLIKESHTWYPPGIYGIPRKCGSVTNWDKFDNIFFGMSNKQTQYIDPRQRKILETTYECLVDAGYNPNELRGSRTGVYIGLASYTCILKKPTPFDSGAQAILACLAANRINFTFDFKGPSLILDTACSTTSVALIYALKAIQSGEIDQAIVGGCNMAFDPLENVELTRSELLSPGGNSNPFCSDRSGYVRSEGVICVFLQKRKNCRRIYAKIVGGKISSDGYGIHGLGHPSIEGQSTLIKDLYEELDISPDDIGYFEAHGTGTLIGDEVECETMTRVFEERQQPLLIGSVKSNAGHGELTAGIMSLIKVITALRTGKIPPTLHLDDPNRLDRSLPGINNGTLKVVNKLTSLPPGLISINGCGYGGVNAHLVVDSCKEIGRSAYSRPKHRLVLFSGRTQEAVHHGLDNIRKKQDDNELLALVDEIHKTNITGHFWRGYEVLGDNPVREVTKCTNARPIWFIYAGMGSQWAKMGKDLLKIDVFRKTFDRCAAALKLHDIDLYDIVTTTDERVYNNLQNSGVAITAIEVCLTDVLLSFGIEPDNYAGHSLGEIACGYADGTITPEQAVLISHARSCALAKAKLPDAQMAAVGLSKEEISKMLPEDIYIACYNSSTSVTISGPLEKTNAFIEELTSRGIFARKVDSCKIAFHSKHVEPVFPYALELKTNVITNPKPRSSKWISTSIPKEKVAEPWARLNCGEYHAHNMCSTVLFDQLYKHIPTNAIVVEVAPRGLLIPILKRELDSNVTLLSLTSNKVSDNEQYLLSAIGNIYNAGGQPQLRKFYQDVKFPVSERANMISPLVKWDHNISWPIPVWKPAEAFGGKVKVNVKNEKFAHLGGNSIYGKVFMPGMGYLIVLWDIVAEMFFLRDYKQVPIVVENLSFKRATIIPPEDDVELLVNISKASGVFEILESGSVVVSGTIKGYDKLPRQIPKPNVDTRSMTIKKGDIYKKFAVRKHKFDDVFKGILESDIKGNNARIEWKGKIDCFLENMAQLFILKEPNVRSVLLQTYIERLTVDSHAFFKAADRNKVFSVVRDDDLNTITCEGVEIIGMELSKAIIRVPPPPDPLLEFYEYVNYGDISKSVLTLSEGLGVFSQIVLQNIQGIVRKVSVLELRSEEVKESLVDGLKVILDEQPLVAATYSNIKNHEPGTKYDIIVAHETTLSLLNGYKFTDLLKENSFVIYNGKDLKIDNKILQKISEFSTDSNDFYLLRPIISDKDQKCAAVKILRDDYSWTKELTYYYKMKKIRRICILAEHNTLNGIRGLINCLRSEDVDLKFQAFIVNNLDDFSLTDECVKKQISCNLLCNILNDNTWGTYIHKPYKCVDKKEVSNATVTMTNVREFSSLQWLETPLSFSSQYEGSKHASVFYSAVTPRDLTYATGRVQSYWTSPIPTDPEILLGFEYSGISNDKRIMGLLDFGAISLQVQTDPNYTWEIRDDWTLEDAATVPLLYATCYHGLIKCGQLQKEKTVFVHPGNDCIAWAAISIALSMGCQIFTAVETLEEKKFLQSFFPEIKEQNIAQLDNVSIKRMIMRNTNQKGTDLIVTTQSVQLFEGSYQQISSCLCKGGRIVEMGSAEICRRTESNTIFGLDAVMTDELFNATLEFKQEIKTLINCGIKNGAVRPLPRKVFSETQIEEALRNVESIQNKEKTLVQIRKEELNVLKSPERKIEATTRLTFDPDKSYIIVGGTSDFGLELTEWMIKKGAKKFLLNSRKSFVRSYLSLYSTGWAEYKNITVEINTDDVAVPQLAQSLIASANKLGPLGGIFTLMGPINENNFENQTTEDFQNAYNCIVRGVENLDKCSRNHCQELDHFVVLSALSCGRGTCGHENYGMAYSMTEWICERRKQENLPALVVQFGPIETEFELTNSVLKSQLIPQSLVSCFGTLEKFMLQSKPIGASTVVLKHTDSNTEKAKSPAEIIANILGIKDLDTIEKSLTMIQLGMDSLMTAEVKQVLYKKFHLEMDVKEIGELTFDYLIKLSEDD